MRCIVDLLVLPDVLLLVRVVELAYPLFTARLERGRVGLLARTHIVFVDSYIFPQIHILKGTKHGKTNIHEGTCVDHEALM